jgi:hypothetical protein
MALPAKTAMRMMLTRDTARWEITRRVFSERKEVID